MKRLFLTMGIVGALSVAFLGSSEPAGACSIYCPPGELRLELVEVRLVRAADEQTPPELPLMAESGTADEWGSLWFDDNSYLSWDTEVPLEETVEVSR